MRFSLRIVIFLVCLNAAANVMVASGFADNVGIEPEVGGDKSVESANETASNIEPSGGGLQTLFGLYNTMASVGQDIFNVVYAGPEMIQNLGAPGWLTTFIFAPMYIIVGADVIYLLLGRI